MKGSLFWFAVPVLALNIFLGGCAGKQALEPTPIPERTETRPVEVEATTAATPTEKPTLIPTSPPALTETLPEPTNLLDPAGWDLGEGQPVSNNPGYTLYALTPEQSRMALAPIIAFYNAMYHSNYLPTLEEAEDWFDTSSQAWTDPEMGFLASYESFSQEGYYPRYEYPIDDPAYFTKWQVRGVRMPEGRFVVTVNFRLEEQGFFVIEQQSGNEVVSTPYWGPFLLTYQTTYQEGSWKIIFRYAEDLGTTLQPTPNS